MKLRRRISFLVALLVTGIQGWGQTEPQSQLWHLESLSQDGHIDYDYNTGISHAVGGVVVTFEDAILSADEATLDNNTGEVVATGNVIVRQGDMTWSGTKVEYNFKTRQMKTGLFKAGTSPYFASGAGLSYDAEGKDYEMQNISMSTDDVADPYFKVRAKVLKISPGEYVEARKATVYAGDTPIFYFPYYHRNLKKHRFFYVPEPGYRSVYGAYLLNGFHYDFNQNLSAATHIDYRWDRGLAGGQDFEFRHEEWGTGNLQTYYTRDKDPHQYKGETWIPEERQWVYFDYRLQLRPDMEIRTAIREQSDRYALRDFREDIYEKNQQPSSFAEFNYDWYNFNLNVLAQPRVNDFFQTVERLPDVKFDAYRQQLGVSPFYYESQSQAGYFDYRYSNMDPFRPDDYSAFRGDTYHQITLPVASFGWLNFSPRVGGRGSFYSESEGSSKKTANVGRAVFNTGAEASFKLSQTWKNAENRFWDVDGLRHVIEPSFNYIFVPDPSRNLQELPQFDELTDAYRLMPLDYPDYNSIDSIDSENVMRLGLRNRLQTERENRLVNLINWALYCDWRLDPREDQSRFSDFYSGLNFYPREWISFTTENRVSTETGDMRESSNYLTLHPSSVWSLAFGYRFMEKRMITGYPDWYSNNLFMGRFTLRINENYAFRTRLQFEARDGTLEEQEYTLYRDMRSWVAAFRFKIRDNREGPMDFSVSFGLQLKMMASPESGGDVDTWNFSQTIS
jgi:lipopolysaccharide assembly outer membrane protein LptD (OstA)